MFELYLFIIAASAILTITYRRSYIFNRDKKIKLKEEVSMKVDELHKERQKITKVRFKEVHVKRRGQKKYDFSKYKLMLRQADLAMAKEQWSEAKRCLIHSLSINQDELNVSLKLARVYVESGDLKRAEMMYKKLVELNQNNPSIYTELAKIYTKKKLYKDAVQQYVKAIEINSQDDKTLVALGQLYQVLMRHSLAAECYRRAAELKPREIHYLFLLAKACESVEDFENALFTYEKILTVEPYNEKASNAANEVRRKMKQDEQVLAMM